MTDHVVVGATVAALAAVERLATAGQRVRWLCTGRPGGAFAPMTVAGRRVGLGLRLIEREYVAGENDRVPPSPDEYVPSHAGHRPWMGLVADYLDDLVPVMEAAETPQLVRGTARVDDFTLTGQLGALTGLLDRTTLATIAAEADAIRETVDSPSGALARPGSDASLRTVSLANHGPTFHQRVVEPIADALVEGGSARIEARQRHKVWAPVYWPQTLWEAASGRTPGFDPRRTFWTDRRGGMSEVVSALTDRISTLPTVQRSNVGRLTHLVTEGETVLLAFEHGHVDRAHRPVIATSPSELFQAAGHIHEPQRVTMGFRWVEVGETAVLRTGATTILDDPAGVFRICAGSPRRDGDGRERRVLSIELRRGANPTDGAVLAACHRVGLIDAAAPAHVIGARTIPAFAAPSAENRQRFEHSLELVRAEHPQVALLAGAAAHGADPLNEQLFAGMHHAMEVCSALA